MYSMTDFLSVIDAYLAVSPIKEKTLSGRMFDDQKKIAKMRGGAGILLSRANDALVWLSENWPEGAVWPKGVARPVSEVAA